MKSDFHLSPSLTMSRQLTDSHRPIVILVALAVGAVLLTVAGGILLYVHTQRLTTAVQMVQHSQDVLSSLQRASSLSDRLELRARLYLATGEEDQLNRARTSANLLSTTAEHLKTLVEDNPNETKNVENLTSCVTGLSDLLNSFNARSSFPEIQIQQCQKTISLMTDQERMLQDDRILQSQRQVQSSVNTEYGLIGIRVAIVVVLFGLLLQNAFQRQRIGKETLLTNRNLAETVLALKDRANESELLTAARDELQLCVDVMQVYQSAANSFSQLLPGTNGALCIINNSRKMVEVVSFWGKTDLGDFAPPESCCGLRSGQPRWRRPGQSEIHCTHFVAAAPERYLCYPIVAHGNTLGILYVQCDDEEIAESVTGHIDGLRHLVQITGMAVATLNLQAKLESQSIRDSLTGLFNRHFLEVSLERELLRAARRKQVLTVLMLDADYFKRFNDSFGHAAGDAALRGI